MVFDTITNRKTVAIRIKFMTTQRSRRSGLTTEIKIKIDEDFVAAYLS